VEKIPGTTPSWWCKVFWVNLGVHIFLVPGCLGSRKKRDLYVLGTLETLWISTKQILSSRGFATCQGTVKTTYITNIKRQNLSQLTQHLPSVMPFLKAFRNGELDKSFFCFPCQALFGSSRDIQNNYHLLVKRGD